MDARTALVVDDEKPIRDALRRLLTRHGLTVTTSASGEEALAMLRDGSPEVLVSDFKMPGMNGAQLIQQARQQRQSLRCILLSGFADLQAEVPLPADVVFIQKPWDPARLVESCLGKQGQP